jgi:hypothetical protein
MSTRPTYKDLECKVKGLEMEREFFQEAISAGSHTFYAIDANGCKIFMVNAASIARYGDHSHQSFCYSWIHKRSTPWVGEEHLFSAKIIKKPKNKCSRPAHSGTNQQNRQTLQNAAW